MFFSEVKNKRKIMKKNLIILGIIVSFFLLFHLHLVYAVIVDRIVAIVNGNVITLSELEKRAAPFLKEYLDDSATEEEKRKIKQQIYAKILPQMIDDYLVDEEIKKLGIKVTDEDVNAAIERICQSNGITLEEFKEKLKKEGLTLEQYKRQMAKQLERMQLINAQVRSKIVITDEQVRDYIRQERGETTYEGPFYIIDHICIVPESESKKDIERARKRAQEALKALKEGIPFNEVAQKYSSNDSIAKELRLGIFSIDEMAPDIKKVVKELEPGEYSKVIRTKLGFEILRLSGISNSKQIDIDPTEMEEVRNKLYREAINERFQEWLNDLRAKSTIRILL